MSYRLSFCISHIHQHYAPILRILLQTLKRNSISYVHRIHPYEKNLNKQSVFGLDCLLDIFVKGEEEKLLEFFEDVSLRLPLSLYFRFLSLEASDFDWEEEENKGEILKEEVEEGVMDARDYKDICADPCNAFYWLSNLEFKELHELTTKEEFSSFLNECISRIQKDSLVLKTPLGRFEVSLKNPFLEAPLDGESPFLDSLNSPYAPLDRSGALMFCDIPAIQSYMRVDRDEIWALASYERPSIMLTSKEIFHSTLGRECRCILPYDAFLSAVGFKLASLGIDYFFLKPSNKEYFFSYDQNVVNSSCITVHKENILHNQILASSLKEVLDPHLQYLQQLDSSNAQDSSNSSPKISRLQPQSLICFLSKWQDSFLYLYSKKGVKKVLDLDFELDIGTLIEELKLQTHGKKLFSNFFKVFADRVKNYVDCDGNCICASKKSSNLFSFLDSIAIFLGLRDARDIVISSKQYLRDRGPRIDYKLLRLEDGNLRLDYIKILSSCLSFSLAGVDKETLCYGIFDSMGEFFGKLISDLSINFEVKNTLFLGSFLQEKILFSKILDNIPSQLNVILSKDGFLDYHLA